MGGHGAHRNEHNIKETDEQMQAKIQRIELIKHNPNHFHLEFFNANNMFNILGGAPSMMFGALGALLSFGYYRNQAAHMRYNFYLNNTRTF